MAGATEDAKALWQVQRLGMFLRNLALQVSGEQDRNKGKEKEGEGPATAEFWDVLSRRRVAKQVPHDHNPVVPPHHKQAVLDTRYLVKRQSIVFADRMFLF